MLFFHTAQVDATSSLCRWLPGGRALTGVGCCCEPIPTHQDPKHQRGSFQPSHCLEALIQELDPSWTQPGRWRLGGSSGPQWAAQVTCSHLFQMLRHGRYRAWLPTPKPRVYWEFSPSSNACFPMAAPFTDPSHWEAPTAPLDTGHKFQLSSSLVTHPPATGMVKGSTQFCCLWVL